MKVGKRPQQCSSLLLQIENNGFKTKITKNSVAVAIKYERVVDYFSIIGRCVNEV
jgi:hypothetical protein